MGQTSKGGGIKEPEKGEVHTVGGNGKLVVNSVEIVKQREVIKVPEVVIEEQHTVKYIPREEKTVKYVAEEVPTVKYNATERDTIKYNTITETTTKYVPEEVKCEKPILVEKPYEKPVLVEKEYTLVTYKDLEAIREAMDLLPKLIEQVKTLKDIRIVEEVVKVPKLQYVATTIKQVSKTGELIQDAN